ncbi:hypothetical protein LTR36_004432 [Oleoguttula mirabilis]|uniref:Protein kinase domain-containing protein n=1 Tax=Oleoguttula mirabilis TaxID=1507867 RepID=A0AAV9JHB0_9PEZI|nr:hypothetical protein LTR36_004432 [Oleoguttula mirabilis]
MQLRSKNVKAPYNASQAHHARKHMLVKFLGAGDNGDTFAALSKADADRIIAKHNAYNILTPAFFNELRAAVTAVKFYKPSNLEGDLQNEIDFLTKTITTKHPRITPCLDSHVRGASQSLTLPFCSGGNLVSFCKHAAAFTPSFIFHVGMQLTEAASLLLFGITDCDNMTPAPEHPTVYHGDVWAGNTLLTLPGNGQSGFGNFPNVVMADFGRATKLHENADSTERARHLRRQWTDIDYIGVIMTGLYEDMHDKTDVFDVSCPAHGVNNGYCADCITATMQARLTDDILHLWIVQFSDVAYAVNRPITEVIPFLKRFIATAKRQRTLHYRPLSAEAVADLSAEKITDGELSLALMQRLTNGRFGEKAFEVKR